MAILINSFSIHSFRGIHDLTVSGLNHVNLIVGDNNCGKTSVLEALLLLRSPADIANFIRIARLRDLTHFRSNTYESFINLFSRNMSSDIPLTLSVEAVTSQYHISCAVSGQESPILLDSSDSVSSEGIGFNGLLSYSIGRKEGEEGNVPVQLNEFTEFSGMKIDNRQLINIHYLSPYDHILGNIIGRIIQNDNYKELCVEILQLFDPDITDLLILKNLHTGRPVEYIKHKKLGNMPISTYGDGIKKVLSLANAIAMSKDGILLIDEVETAIHSKYYSEIFTFLVMACQQFHVQLFITTHNIEAVDSLLATQNYDEQNDYDHITVVTLKKNKHKTLSRILTGRQVTTDRESFGFEVRL